MSLMDDQLTKITNLLKSKDLSLVREGTKLVESLLDTEEGFCHFIEQVTGAIFISERDFEWMIRDMQKSIRSLAKLKVEEESIRETIKELIHDQSQHPVVIGRTPYIIEFLFQNISNNSIRSDFYHNDYLKVWSFGVLARWDSSIASLETLTFDSTCPLADSMLNLKSLKTLKIGCAESLDTVIGDLTTLTTLDLSCGNLAELPESIGNLSNLTSLDVSDNSLNELPDSIGNLTNLTTLNLRATELESIPESIGNLTNLRKLDISWTNIEPDEVKRIQSALPSCEVICE